MLLLVGHRPTILSFVVTPFLCLLLLPMLNLLCCYSYFHGQCWNILKVRFYKWCYSFVIENTNAAYHCQYFSLKEIEWKPVNVAMMLGGSVTPMCHMNPMTIEEPLWQFLICCSTMPTCKVKPVPLRNHYYS